MRQNHGFPFIPTTKVLLPTAVALLLCGAPEVARADPMVPAAADRPRVQELGARLASGLTSALGSESGEVLLGIQATLPERAPRPQALLDALLAPLRESFGAREDVWMHDETTELAGEAFAREAAARGFDAAVRIGFHADGGHLRIAADVWSTGHGWAPAFVPQPHLRASLSLRVPLGAELRSYVGALPRLSGRDLKPLPLDLPGELRARRYLLLAAADLDRDGRDEVLVATDGSLVALRVEDQAARILARAAWPDLTVAPSRPRRSFATAVRRDERLLIRSSEYEETLSVRLAHGVLEVRPVADPCPEGRFPVERGCASRTAGRDWFTPRLLDSRGDEVRAIASFYVRRARSVRQPDGSMLPVEALISPNGRLLVRVAERRAGITGYGAALALGDADHDGAPELLSSAPSDRGDRDRLHLLRARRNGTLVPVWQSEPLPGAVLLADAGDVDGDGQIELIALEEPAGPAEQPARLWVLP